MDSVDLFQSCRRGDLDRVKYLCEHKEVDVNLRDRWDSTPLYYACLCGHYDLVLYLLERGSICDASTFDGERCVYGALTNQIRKLLLEHRMLTTVTMRREAYTEFLRRLLEDNTHSDITFYIHGVKMSAHRCILSARSQFFTDQLETRWKNKHEVHLKKKEISIAAFRSVLEWLYTSQTKVDVSDMDEFGLLVRYCRLQQLSEDLDKAFKKADAYVKMKRGAAIKTLYIESKRSLWDLQQDLGVLALQALPNELREWNCGTELPCMPRVEQQFVDVVFQVGNYKFYAHKPILFARSEYFRALLQDHFGESEMDDASKIPIIKINHVSPRVLGDVLMFVYTDSCTITEDYVSELLTTADEFLLPGLKKGCGNWLGGYIDQDTVMDILKTARIFRLPRLEDACTEYIANYIEMFVDDPSLLEMIESDAMDVKDRQETDSITIVDDIRSHIRSNVRTMSDMVEAESKFSYLESMLVQLGLDA